MPVCEIRWVKDGVETPDANEAIGRAHLPRIVRQIRRARGVPGRDWLFICADHAREVGCGWKIETFEAENAG